jgi:hypothetical protein
VVTTVAAITTVAGSWPTRRGRRAYLVTLARVGQHTLGEIQALLQRRHPGLQMLTFIEVLAEVCQEIKLFSYRPALTAKKHDPHPDPADDETVEQGPEYRITHVNPSGSGVPGDRRSRRPLVSASG